MKKIFLVSATFLVAALDFWGCKSSVTPPEVTFGETPAMASIKAGDSKEINLAVKTKGRLKVVTFFCKDEKSGEETLFNSPVVKFPNKSRYESVVTLQDIRKNVIFVVEAVDTKNQTTRAEYVITVGDSTGRADSSYAGGNASRGTIEMGFNYFNARGSSFSVKNGTAPLLGEAKYMSADIDFMFFYGKLNGATIAAPSDEVTDLVFNNASCGVQTWATRNATVFTKLSASFDNVDLANVETELNNSASTSVNHLNAGDVIAFKTVSGQIGVVQLVDAANAFSAFNVSVKILK